MLQTEDPAAEYLPATQSVHTEASVAAEYVPATQSVHFLDQRPIAHAQQASEASLPSVAQSENVVTWAHDGPYPPSLQ